MHAYMLPCVLIRGVLLGRYAAPLQAGSQKPSYSVAAKFYRQATEVFPDGVLTCAYSYHSAQHEHVIVVVLGFSSLTFSQ